MDIPPFGHAGERALDKIYAEGFRHYEQSLRVVDRVEKGGEGLNLCRETRIGIASHTHGAPGDSLEARCVRLCDRIAYINHDLDDALRAGILREEEVPALIRDSLGDRGSRRINTFITDIIEESAEGELRMSPPIGEVFTFFHDFMFEHVYLNPSAKGEEAKVENILRGIWEYYVNHPDKLPPDYRSIGGRDGLERAVTDYVSGMTDSYAMETYGSIFIPMAWSVK